MQTKKKIEGQIDLLKRLDAVMPHRSYFGTDNHQSHLDQIDVLNGILKFHMDDDDAEAKLDERYDELEDEGAEAGCDDAIVEAYRWFIDGAEADDLATEADVKLFTEKKAREGK